jgi:hypothetical protein
MKAQIVNILLSKIHPDTEIVGIEIGAVELKVNVKEADGKVSMLKMEYSVDIPF